MTSHLSPPEQRLYNAIQLLGIQVEEPSRKKMLRALFREAQEIDQLNAKAIWLNEALIESNPKDSSTCHSQPKYSHSQLLQMDSKSILLAGVLEGVLWNGQRPTSIKSGQTLPEQEAEERGWLIQWIALTLARDSGTVEKNLGFKEEKKRLRVWFKKHGKRHPILVDWGKSFLPKGVWRTTSLVDAKQFLSDANGSRKFLIFLTTSILFLFGLIAALFVLVLRNQATIHELNLKVQVLQDQAKSLNHSKRAKFKPSTLPSKKPR